VGGLGLEALSRGALAVTLVEKDPRAAERLARWIESVGAKDEAVVLRRDATRGALPPGPFDLVFADPPFSHWETEDGARDLVRRAVDALAASGLVALKVPASLELPRDPAWRLLRRTEMGSVAYLLVERARGAAPEAAPNNVPS
jgi:16S rRNA (guanine966-N2)-methyltransferase